MLFKILSYPIAGLFLDTEDSIHMSPGHLRTLRLPHALLRIALSALGFLAFLVAFILSLCHVIAFLPMQFLLVLSIGGMIGAAAYLFRGFWRGAAVGTVSLVLAIAFYYVGVYFSLVLEYSLWMFFLAIADAVVLMVFLLRTIFRIYFRKKFRYFSLVEKNGVGVGVPLRLPFSHYAEKRARFTLCHAVSFQLQENEDFYDYGVRYAADLLSFCRLRGFFLAGCRVYREKREVVYYVYTSSEEKDIRSLESFFHRLKKDFRAVRVPDTEFLCYNKLCPTEMEFFGMYNALVFSAYDPAKITVGETYVIGFFSVFKDARQAEIFVDTAKNQGFTCECIEEKTESTYFSEILRVDPLTKSYFSVVAVQQMRLVQDDINKATEMLLRSSRENEGVLLYWDLLSGGHLDNGKTVGVDNSKE